jgi:hypothetical protein
MALTPTTYELLVPGTYNIDLVIPPFSLVGGLDYVFILTATASNSSSTSLLISMNEAPQPGTFTVSPLAGTELVDTFTLSAPFWEDADLPMRYSFSYYKGSNILPLSQDILDSSFSTVLPAGRDVDNFVVRLVVYISDAFGAVSNSSQSCNAYKVDADIVSEFLNSLLRQSGRRILSVAPSVRLSDVSIGISVLNDAFCMKSPVCAKLNRENCSYVENTCGPCLSGYFDELDSRDGNTSCVQLSLFTGQCYGVDAVKKSSCLGHADCGPWEFCDTWGQCQLESKSCDFDCSGHGECLYLSYDLKNESLSNCSRSDSSCYAKCRCTGMFKGSGCQYESDSLETANLNRFTLLQLIDSAISEVDISPVSLNAFADMLYLLVVRSDEIGTDLSDAMFTTAINLIEIAHANQINYEHLKNLLGAISASAFHYLSSSETAMRLQEFINGFNLLWKQSTSQFEFPMTRSYDFFTVSLGSALFLSNETDLIRKNSFVATVPSTVSSCLNGLSSIEIHIDHEVAIDDRFSFVSIPNHLLPSTQGIARITDGLLSSIMLGVEKNRSMQIEIELQNYFPPSEKNTSVTPFDYDEVFESRCESNVTSSTWQVCSYSGLNITHQCSGMAGRFRTKCPNLFDIVVTQCQNLYTDGTAQCSLLSFDESTTLCSCLLFDNVSNSDWDTLFVVGGTLNFELLSPAPSIFFEDIEAPSNMSYVVFITFGFFVSSLIFWISALHLRSVFSDEDEGEVDMTYYEAIADVINDSRLTESFLDRLLPEVYTTQGWWDLISRHRWVAYFFRNPETDYYLFHMRNIAEGYISAITAMLLITAFYFVFEENDDYCYQFIDKGLCLSSKTPLFAMESMCSWNPDNQRCSFREVNSSVRSIIMIALVVTIATIVISAGLSEILLYSIWGTVEEDKDGKVTLSTEAKHVQVVKDFDFINRTIVKKRNNVRYEPIRRQMEESWCITKIPGENSLLVPQAPSIFSWPQNSKLQTVSNRVWENLNRAHDRWHEVNAELSLFTKSIAESERWNYYIELFMDSKIVQHMIIDISPDYERDVFRAALKKEFEPDLEVSHRIILQLCDLALFFYLWAVGLFVIYFGYTRSKGVQNLWGYTFLVWFLLDCFVIQTNSFYLRHYWCPTWARESVAKSVELIRSYMLDMPSTPEFHVSINREAHPLKVGDATGRVNVLMFASALMAADVLKMGIRTRAMDLIVRFASPFPTFPLIKETSIFRSISDLVFRYNPIMLIYMYAPDGLEHVAIDELVAIFWCSLIYIGIDTFTSAFALWRALLFGFLGLIAMWFVTTLFLHFEPETPVLNSADESSPETLTRDVSTAWFDTGGTNADSVTLRLGVGDDSLPSDRDYAKFSEPSALATRGERSSGGGLLDSLDALSSHSRSSLSGRQGLPSSHGAARRGSSAGIMPGMPDHSTLSESVNKNEVPNAFDAFFATPWVNHDFEADIENDEVELN